MDVQNHDDKTKDNAPGAQSQGSTSKGETLGAQSLSVEASRDISKDKSQTKQSKTKICGAQSVKDRSEPKASLRGPAQDNQSEPNCQQSVFDPYIMVNKYDRAAVRRQRKLARAAKKKEDAWGKNATHSLADSCLLKTANQGVPTAVSSNTTNAGGPVSRKDQGLASSAASVTDADRPVSTTNQGPQSSAAPANAGGPVSSSLFSQTVSQDAVLSASKKPSASKRKKRLIIASASFAVVALVSCCLSYFIVFPALQKPAFEAYAQTGISIAGITDQDFIVTPRQLAELPCVQEITTGQGRGEKGESKAGTLSAYGPTLETFLGQYGLQASDFSRIVALCKDGYRIVLARESLNDKVILTLSAGSEALQAHQQPLRFIIPDEASGQWGYGVMRIEFER